MARASLFLTKTDADSIRSQQVRNGSWLLVLVLVDACATLWLFFTREGTFKALIPELRAFTTAATFKGGTGDLIFLLVLRVGLYFVAGGLAIGLGKQRNKAPPPPSGRAVSRQSSAASLRETNRDDVVGTLAEPLLPASVAPSEARSEGATSSTLDIRVGEATPDPDASGNFDPNLFAPSEDDPECAKTLLCITFGELWPLLGSLSCAESP